MQSVDKAKEDLLALLAQHAEAHDGTPISGRILGYLLFAEEDVSFGELAEKLGISRGSVSLNTRRLVDKGIVRRVNREGARGDFFRIDLDQMNELLAGVVAHLRGMSDGLQSIAGRLPEGGIVRGRLLTYAGFHERVAAGLETAVADAIRS